MNGQNPHRQTYNLHATVLPNGSAKDFVDCSPSPPAYGGPPLSVPVQSSSATTTPALSGTAADTSPPATYTTFPPATSPPPTLPRAHTVVYQVTSNVDRRSVCVQGFSVTYVNSDGTTGQDTNAAVPWQLTTRLRSGDFFDLLAQEPPGCLDMNVTCTVIVDGNQLMQHTSTGQSAIADCHGSVP